jgi:hypothetical protein
MILWGVIAVIVAACAGGLAAWGIRALRDRRRNQEDDDMYAEVHGM